MKKVSVNFSLKHRGVVSAKEQVAERLRQAIYTGELKAGEELIQEELATQLGVSRIPVREAFQILDNAGMIEIQKNKRAIVKAITKENISEQLEIRTILECLSAEKACDRAEDFSILEEINNQIKNLETTPNYEMFRELNTSFHYELWHLAESPRLEKMLHQLWFSIPSVYPADILENIQRNILEHDKIIDSLKKHDKIALQEAMIKHINTSKDKIYRQLFS